jgi:hypothetical protein
MLECMALAVLPPRSQRGKRRRQRNRPCGSKDGSVQRAANAHSNGNIMATHMDRFRPNSPINTTHVVVDFVPHTTRRRGAQALFQPPTGWSRRRWWWRRRQCPGTVAARDIALAGAHAVRREHIRACQVRPAKCSDPRCTLRCVLAGRICAAVARGLACRSCADATMSIGGVRGARLIWSWGCFFPLTRCTFRQRHADSVGCVTALCPYVLRHVTSSAWQTYAIRKIRSISRIESPWISLWGRIFELIRPACC